MRYKITESAGVLLRSDGVFVPVDDAEYGEWLASGNTPDPLDETPPIVGSVTPWQIRKALTQIGLRAAVESAVASADQDTRDGWQYAAEFRRDNVLIRAVASAIGKTTADIDALFDLAATL